MKTKNILFLLFIQIFLSQTLFSQFVKEKKPSVWDRIYFGGNLGLQFGDITDIEVSPHVGYYIYPRWAVGAGFSYEYYKEKYYYTPYGMVKSNRETNIYGWNLFTELNLIPDIGKIFGRENGISLLSHVEFEQLSLDRQYFEYPYTATGRYWMESFLVGGGIKQALGRRSNIYLLLLWNLNETVNSPYSNPIFKFGFNF